MGLNYHWEIDNCSNLEKTTNPIKIKQVTLFIFDFTEFKSAINTVIK